MIEFIHKLWVMGYCFGLFPARHTSPEDYVS